MVNAAKIQQLISRSIQKYGVPVTWVHKTFGATDPNTGDPAESTSTKTISVLMESLTVADVNINVGWMTNDTRSIVTKYTDILSTEDELIWNGQRFTVMGNPQDISAIGVVLLYKVNIKRTSSGV